MAIVIDHHHAARIDMGSDESEVVERDLVVMAAIDVGEAKPCAVQCDRVAAAFPDVELVRSEARRQPAEVPAQDRGARRFGMKSSVDASNVSHTMRRSGASTQRAMKTVDRP